MNKNVGMIKRAEIQDSDHLAHIYSQCWRATWQGIFPHAYIEGMIARRNALWWAKNLKRATTPPPLIFQYDNQEIGYINYGKSRYGDSGFEGEIYELNVLPEFQGLGFGSQLFESARADLEKAEKLGLIAWSLATNQKCCAFFEAKGGTAFTKTIVRFGDKGILKEYDRIGYSWPAY